MLLLNPLCKTNTHIKIYLLYLKNIVSVSSCQHLKPGKLFPKARLSGRYFKNKDYPSMSLFFAAYSLRWADAAVPQSQAPAVIDLLAENALQGADPRLFTLPSSVSSRLASAACGQLSSSLPTSVLYSTQPCSNT